MILVHSILTFCFFVSSYCLFARCNNFLPKHHTPQMPHGTSLGLPSKPRSSTRPNGRLVQCTPLGKKLDICSTSGNQMKSEVWATKAFRSFHSLKDNKWQNVDAGLWQARADETAHRILGIKMHKSSDWWILSPACNHTLASVYVLYWCIVCMSNNNNNNKHKHKHKQQQTTTSNNRQQTVTRTTTSNNKHNNEDNNDNNNNNHNLSNYSLYRNMGAGPALARKKTQHPEACIGLYIECVYIYIHI